MNATTTLEAVSLIKASTSRRWADFLRGSITVHPHNNTEYEPVELGASIFVDANKNLLRAANEFNLSLYGFDDEDGDMAIWDGERISHRV